MANLGNRQGWNRKGGTNKEHLVAQQSYRESQMRDVLYKLLDALGEERYQEWVEARIADEDDASTIQGKAEQKLKELEG